MPFLSSITTNIENNPPPVLPANNIPIIANGGIIITNTDAVGEFKIHIFESNGTFQLTQAYRDATFEVLLVGAGGSGAASHVRGMRPVYNILEYVVPYLGNNPYYAPAAGGGSGSVIYLSNLVIPVGNNTITVGNTAINNGNTSFSDFIAGGTTTIVGGKYHLPPEKVNITSLNSYNLYYEAHDGTYGASSYVGDPNIRPYSRWLYWPYDKSYGWDQNYFGVTHNISGQNVAYAVPGPTGRRTQEGYDPNISPTDPRDPFYNNTLPASLTPGSGGKGATGQRGKDGIVIIKYYVNSPENKIFLSGGRVTANTNYTFHEFRNVTNWPLTFNKLPKDERIDILISSPGNLEPFGNGGSGSVRIFYDQQVEFGDVYYIDAKSLKDLQPGGILNIPFGTNLVGDIIRINRGAYYTAGFGGSWEPERNAFGTATGALKINNPGSGYRKGDQINALYRQGGYPPQPLLDGGYQIIDTDPDFRLRKAAEVRVRKYSTYFKSKPLTEWSLKSYTGRINKPVFFTASSDKSYSSNTLTNFFGFGTDCYDDEVLTLSDYGNYVTYDPTGNVFTNGFFTANDEGIYLDFNGSNTRYAAAASQNPVSRNPSYITMQDQYTPPDPATVIIRYRSYVPPNLPNSNPTTTPTTTTSGSVTLTTPGVGYWTCPANVYSVSVACIGGGGAGGVNFERGVATGGGGAGLAWKNNIPVKPGTKYMYKVGLGGQPDAGESDELFPPYQPPGPPGQPNPNPFIRRFAPASWPGGAGGGGQKSFFIDDWLVCAAGGGGGTGGDRMAKSWFWSNPNYSANWQSLDAIRARKTAKSGESNTFANYTKKDTKSNNFIYFLPPRDANYVPEIKLLSETTYANKESLPVNPIDGYGYITTDTNSVWVYENEYKDQNIFSPNGLRYNYRWVNLGKSSFKDFNWLNQYNSNGKNILISVGGRGDRPDDPEILSGNTRTTIQGGGWAGQGGGLGKSSNTAGMFGTQLITNVPYQWQLYLNFTQTDKYNPNTKTLISGEFYTPTGGAGAGGYDDSVTSGGGGNAGKGIVTLGFPESTGSTGETLYGFLRTISAVPAPGGGGVGILGKGQTGTDALVANTSGRGGSNGSNGGLVTTQNYDWRMSNPRFTQVPGKGGSYGAGSGGGNAEGADGYYEFVMVVPGFGVLAEANMGRGAPGANGAIKIVWGPNKGWPNSNTATS